MGNQETRKSLGSRLVPWICAVAAASLVVEAGSLGSSASAELPMTGDPVLREAQHAETHAEPSDEDLIAVSVQLAVAVLEGARRCSNGG